MFLAGLSNVLVIFRKLFVRVIDINNKGTEPPRRLYVLRVHQFSKCLISLANQRPESPPAPVSFQNFIASPGVVLISSHYQKWHHSVLFLFLFIFFNLLIYLFIVTHFLILLRN